MSQSRTHICIGSTAQDKFWKERFFDPLKVGTRYDKSKETIEKKVREFYPPRNPPVRGPLGETLLHRLILGDPDTKKKALLKKVLDFLLTDPDYKDSCENIVSHAYNRKSATGNNTSTSYKELVFDGETGLHLAIAFRNTELVKQLLDHGADVCARAYGSTFAPGSDKTYFGEYPLSLCAAIDNQESADLLLKKFQDDKSKPKNNDNNINTSSTTSQVEITCERQEVTELILKRDSFGNTAFHIAIINHQIDFYIYLVTYAKEKLNMTAKEISELYGAMGLTPLTLSVLWYPDGSGFRRVLDTIKGEFIWKFSDLEARLYPLQQIDSLPSESYVSVIYLVTKYCILELAEEHLLLSILDEKWIRNLRIPAYIALLMHMIFLSITSAYTVLLHPHGRLDDKRAILLQQLVLVMSGIYFVGFLYDIKVCLHYQKELRTIERKPFETDAKKKELEQVPKGFDLSTQEWKTYRNMRRKAAYPEREVIMHSLVGHFGVPLTCWDVVGWLGTIFVFLHAITRSSTDLSSAKQSEASVPSSYILLGIADSLMWLSTLSYMNMFEKTGLLVSMISRTVGWDFLPFVAVFASFICGVSVAMFAIQRKGMSLSQVLDQLKRLSIGVYQHETFEPEGHGEPLRIVSYVFLLIFTLLSLLLLLNLLIATLSTTYKHFVEKAHQIWSIQRASRILLWEARLRYVLKKRHTNPKQQYHMHVGKVTSDGPEGTFSPVPNSGSNPPRKRTIPDNLKPRFLSPEPPKSPRRTVESPTASQQEMTDKNK